MASKVTPSPAPCAYPGCDTDLHTDPFGAYPYPDWHFFKAQSKKPAHVAPTSEGGE
jgi:hypothetical protein